MLTGKVVDEMPDIELNEEGVEESFEDILQGYKVIDNSEDNVEIMTEPLCASCYMPLDVDEKQKTAYCEKCETEVFVERRIISPLEVIRSSFE